MTAPIGGAAGGGAPAAPVPPVDTDPRRPRLEGTPMTLFLMEIGSQHRPPPEDAGLIYRVNEEQQVQMALELGDIAQVGTTEPPAPPEEGGAAAAVPESYSIYQFEGAEGNDFLKFTLDPNLRELAGMSYPPYIPHQPGQVHHGMESALWGGYCYDHPTPQDRHQQFQDLCTGIRVRYSGDNAQLVSDDDGGGESDGDGNG
ncbi:MAG: hypothetical protein ACRCWB_01055 [Enterovibrio sp.]